MKSRTTTHVLAVAGLAISVASHAQITGPSTAHPPYMVASDLSSGVRFVSIASNGNGTGGLPNETYVNLGTGANTYRLVGIPDGAGVFRTPQDIADGSFTALVNHELGNTSGIVREHGSRGALVSRWRIRSNPGAANHLQVIGGRDLIQNVAIFDTATLAFFPTLFNAANPMLNYTGNVYGGANPSNNGFGRFCSADLAAPSAYRFGEFGTDERIFLNGEEIGAPGRIFAHVVTGPNAGTSYELAQHGDYSWENAVSSPFPQLKTIVIGIDDATPGNLHIFVGDKKNTGNDVERAGLVDGKVYAVVMSGTTIQGTQRVEDRVNILGDATSGPVSSKRFTMADMGDVRNITGAAFQTLGDSLGQINFLRPEDGAWDTTNPRRFYFVTTDSFAGNSRLWEVLFDDITQPELGGVVTMLGDGSVPATWSGGIVSSTGATDVRMMDNICTTRRGDVLIQEDVGNNARLGRMWLYQRAADRIVEVGIPDSRFFLAGASQFLTQDEETSGIVDAWDEIGPGWFFLDMQAHYAIAGELAEGGQLMAAFIPQTLPSNCPGDANYNGIVNFDDLNIVLSNFSKTGVGIPGDLNFDGRVDFLDLNIVLGGFGATCN